MDEVKDKFKGFVKKLNNPFGPSNKFKGEGHKLGSDLRPSTSTAAKPNYVGRADRNEGKGQAGNQQQQGDWRRLQQEKWEREKGGGALHSENSTIRPDPKGFSSQDGPLRGKQTTNGSAVTDISKALQSQKSGNNSFSYSPISSDRTQTSAEFDPFVSHIGSARQSDVKVSKPAMFECPVCGSSWKSEEEVSSHLDNCLRVSDPDGSAHPETRGKIPDGRLGEESHPQLDEEQIKFAVGTLLSGGPSTGSLDVIIRLFRNIVNDPASEKFRKIRMGNPKIHEAVGMTLGGVELLKSVGFCLQAEGDEIWAVMEQPSANQIEAVKGVIADLEHNILEQSSLDTTGTRQQGNILKENSGFAVNGKVDRKIRVFHAAPEMSAADIELPDSFFELSVTELRQEAAGRKKKLEDSQLLIPKSYRERQTAASKQRYKATIIRVQFPDGGILQGMFMPKEPTTALYEFVSSSLKDSNLEFDLVFLASRKNQIIPCLGDMNMSVPTMEEADLVPAALVKFRSSKTFTGLRPDLLAISEPFTPVALPKQETRF